MVKKRQMLKETNTNPRSEKCGLWIKNSNNRYYNIILDVTEEIISDLEDSIVGITQNAPQRYK